MSKISNLIKFFILFSSFCTSRLYGTFSEKRNEIVVVVTRWTYAFLLIHNLVAIANYILNTLINLKIEEILSAPGKPGYYYELSRDILHEIELFTVILSVPISYVFGMKMNELRRVIQKYFNVFQLVPILFQSIQSLVTQPMMQRPPNRTELRSMDSYIQIL